MRQKKEEGEGPLRDIIDNHIPLDVLLFQGGGEPWSLTIHMIQHGDRVMQRCKEKGALHHATK